MGTQMSNRKLFFALMVSAFFTLTPLLIQLSTESDPLRSGAGLLMMPGVLVSIVLAGGLVHGAAWQIIVVVNFMFYSAVAYLILAVRERLRARFKLR
jgi:hypothetical protein